MAALNKVFIVIDPTNDHQIALERATRMAGRDELDHVHAYCAVFSTANAADLEALKRVEIEKHRVWLESLVAPIREMGKAVDLQVEWTMQWRDALAPAAKSCAANLIIKAASSHRVAGRRLLKTADWTLLRQAHCPVYLAKGGVIQKGARLLVALDLKKEDDLHNTLNQRVIQIGKALTSNVEASSLHAVNAYSSSERYVYPSDLAAEVGIPDQHAHTIEGPPAKVIAEVANEIGAAMVIIGNASRQGARAAVIGNTAEKVLDALDANVLVVPSS